MATYTKTLSSYYGLTCRVTWTESINIEANTSTISVTRVELAASEISGTHYASGSISINGTRVYSFSSAAFYTASSPDRYNTLANVKGYAIVPHDPDGRGTAVISVAIDSVVDLQKDATSQGSGGVTYIRVPWRHYTAAAATEIITLIVIAGGTGYIDTAADLAPYLPFVDTGGGWTGVTPMIDIGEAWVSVT